MCLALGDDRRCAGADRLVQMCCLALADATGGVPHNVRGASPGSRRGSVLEFGENAKLIRQRDDKAGFAPCKLPYKHGRCEYIVGLGG
jgi:hypothetical protein